MHDETENTHYFYHQESGYRELAESIVKQAKKRGASQAEVYLEWGEKSHIQVRMRETESIKQSSFKGLGLRFFKNGRLGFVSSTDFSPEGVSLLIDQAVELADFGSEDKFIGLPDRLEIKESNLDIFDDECLSMPR